MTREQTIEGYLIKEHMQELEKDLHYKDMYISTLEATQQQYTNLNTQYLSRIAELEATKTCDGCEYFFKDYAGCKIYERDMTRCSRQFESDYYQPKETS